MHDRYPLRTFTANLKCVERAERAGTQVMLHKKTMMMMMTSVLRTHTTAECHYCSSCITNCERHPSSTYICHHWSLLPPTGLSRKGCRGALDYREQSPQPLLYATMLVYVII